MHPASLTLHCSINKFVSSIKVAATNQTQNATGNPEAKAVGQLRNAAFTRQNLQTAAA
jgi:hypothetical protein